MTSLDLSSIETPGVLVDYAKLVRNIDRAQRLAVANHIALRPHVKTHKSLEVARLQMQAGAVGVTASKADEALVFLEGRIESVTVAYPQLDTRKCARLLSAAMKHRSDLRLTVDSLEGIKVASDAAGLVGVQCGVFLEIDVGLHRCGMKETDPRLVHFIEEIHRSRALKFIGLLSHAGHAYAAKGADQVRRVAREESEVLNRIRSRIENIGFEVKEVSVGATPTFLVSTSYGGITEARPGNYVFMDLTPVRLGIASAQDVSLSVLATIVSANEEYFIIDAGSKVLSSDLGAHGTGSGLGYGVAYTLDDYEVSAQGLSVARLSEEHGFVKRTGRNLAIGTRLRVIPNHACPVVNLAEQLIVIKDGDLVCWSVDARAKVR
jgi:D-serine deaminase-like pyridoxal phosphate-dependent protein